VCVSGFATYLPLRSKNPRYEKGGGDGNKKPRTKDVMEENRDEKEKQTPTDVLVLHTPSTSAFPPYASNVGLYAHRHRNIDQ
jgi:hypothetical protein